MFTIERITMRRDPIYHSTYTGKPPDEPAMLGVALNEVFVPLLQKQFPEIADFYLPPEGCSYRLAVVAMKKQYAGHAKRVMFGVWSFLRQFMYTKFIVVTDDDVDIRDWKEVIWAITTRVDPARDTLIVPNTPIDYLDFASPVAGLGSKMGIDATNKWPGETARAMGPADRDGPGGQRARRSDLETIDRADRTRRVHQQADQEAERRHGRADRAPRIVVHVIVGDARRRARAIHRLAFQLLQPQLRGQQLRFDLRAQVLRALAGLVAGALQQVLGFASASWKNRRAAFRGRGSSSTPSVGDGSMARHCGAGAGALSPASAIIARGDRACAPRCEADADASRHRSDRAQAISRSDGIR